MSSMTLNGLVYILRYVQLDRFIEKPFQIGIRIFFAFFNKKGILLPFRDCVV
jgi:hypothetical protein